MIFDSLRETSPGLVRPGRRVGMTRRGVSVCGQQSERAGDAKLLRGMLWPASARCNGAPLSETKVKGNSASRFSTRSARNSSPSSRKVTPSHHLPRIKRF